MQRIEAVVVRVLATRYRKSFFLDEKGGGIPREMLGSFTNRP